MQLNNFDAGLMCDSICTRSSVQHKLSTVIYWTHGLIARRTSFGIAVENQAALTDGRRGIHFRREASLLKTKRSDQERCHLASRH